MRYYLFAHLISHAWERSHQIVPKGVNALLRAVPRQEVPDDVECASECEVPDLNVVGGCPAVKVVTDGYRDQADRRLVGRLLACPSR